jgi:hypothetical protein
LTQNWELDGLIFVDTVAADPASDGTTVYSPTHEFTMNYTNSNGQEATYTGETIATLQYGSDSRDTGNASGIWMQDMDGQSFMFTTGQSGGGVDIYRFVPGTDIAIHCGFINTYDEINGTAYVVVARDLNGDGQLESNEYTLGGVSTISDVFGFSIDSNGNIWTTSDNSGLREFTFQGLDGNGSPIYSSTYKSFTKPSQLNSECRSIYDPSTDTMYISGYTTAVPKASTDGTWGSAGSEVLCYHNWSTTRTLAWQTALPYNTSNASDPTIAKSISLAGDRLFVGMCTTGTILAYDTTTGALVATMARGPEIGGLGGWLDTVQAISAYRRSDGEYEIFTEDDLLAKDSMIRVGGITPTNLTATTGGAGQVNLTWSDNNNDESGFVLQQSTDGVNFSTAATLPANMTSYSVTGLSNSTHYYYRIKATNWFDDSPFSTISSVVTTGPLALSGTNYLEVDANPLYLDIWSNSTRSGSPAQQLLGSITSISVTVDFSQGNPLTSGALNFNGSSGTDTLQVVGTSGNDAVTVNASSVTIASSFGSATINYTNTEAITFNGGSGNDTLTQTAQPGGNATLAFLGTTSGDTLNISAGTFSFPVVTGNTGQPTAVTLGTLSIGSNAVVTLPTPTNGQANRMVLVLNALTINGSTGHWNGTLDLGDNDLIVKGGSAPQINDQLLSGLGAAGTYWSGKGIADSAAAQAPGMVTTLAGFLNSNGSGSTILSTFDGQSVGTADVVVKYTYYGDADLNGKVDGSDYSRIDNGFLSRLTGWYNGDFNYDNIVNGSDYTLIDNAFNRQGSALAPSAAIAQTAAAIAHISKSASIPVVRWANPGSSGEIIARPIGSAWTAVFNNSSQIINIETDASAEDLLDKNRMAGHGSRRLLYAFD